ncbi:MAG: hypothetical protein SOH60_08265 [Lachnospiraceae bacterium]
MNKQDENFYPDLEYETLQLPEKRMPKARESGQVAREKNLAYVSGERYQHGKTARKPASEEKVQGRVQNRERTEHSDPSTTTVLSAMRYILTPVILIGAAIAMIAVYPLRLFDSRWRDVLIYECGIVIAVVIALYGLWHSRKGIEHLHVQIYGPLRKEWNHYGIVACIAIILGFSSYYMNATYEEMHTIGERWILIFSGILIGLMLNHNGTPKDPTKPKVKIKVSWWFLILTGIFFLLFIWNRTGRTWVVVMGVLWGVLLVRFAFWKDKHLWLRDVCTGICVNFIASVFWAMFRRYYLAYRLSRFGLQFFTVTVTGYYLVMVEGAILTLLFEKSRRVRDEKFAVRLAYLWKEWLLFGIATAYMVMTITRTGYLALAVNIFLALLIEFHGQFRYFFRTIGCMILALAICFPMIFTGQRLISTVNGRPVIFEDVEGADVPDVVRRNVKWNSTRFMNIEVFVRDVGDRIIGGDVGSNWYYGHDFNVLQSNSTASADETDVKTSDDGDTLLAKIADSLDSFGVTYDSDGVPMLLTVVVDENGEEQSLDNGDYSNGRGTIWKAYLAGIGMTGHDIMGAELPDGQLAPHAHNNVLQMMWDCGIPTGVVFGLFLLACLVLAIRYRRRYHSLKSRAFFPLLMIVGFLVVGSVEWMFQLCNPYTLTLMFTVPSLMFENVTMVRVRRRQE